MDVVSQAEWRTLHLPGFPLLLFGNLLHLLVINVVLAHKAVNSPVQQVDGWTHSDRRRERKTHRQTEHNDKNQRTRWFIGLWGRGCWCSLCEPPQITNLHRLETRRRRNGVNCTLRVHTTTPFSSSTVRSYPFVVAITTRLWVSLSTDVLCRYGREGGGWSKTE